MVGAEGVSLRRAALTQPRIDASTPSSRPYFSERLPHLQNRTLKFRFRTHASTSPSVAIRKRAPRTGRNPRRRVSRQFYEAHSTPKSKTTRIPNRHERQHAVAQKKIQRGSLARKAENARFNAEVASGSEQCCCHMASSLDLLSDRKGR